MAVQPLLRFAACEHREVIECHQAGNGCCASTAKRGGTSWLAIKAACGEAVPLV
jgi:hypothetical protein